MALASDDAVPEALGSMHARGRRLQSPSRRLRGLSGGAEPDRPFQKKLTAVAQVRTGAPRADFWLQRRGTDANVGKPTYSPQWSQYNIGITVKRTDLVDPRYLYYWFELLWMKGYWQRLNYGTLPLRHIRAEDVCRLVVTFDP